MRIRTWIEPVEGGLDHGFSFTLWGCSGGTCASLTWRRDGTMGSLTHGAQMQRTGLKGSASDARTCLHRFSAVILWQVRAILVAKFELLNIEWLFIILWLIIALLWQGQNAFTILGQGRGFIFNKSSLNLKPVWGVYFACPSSRSLKGWDVVSNGVIWIVGTSFLAVVIG